MKNMESRELRYRNLVSHKDQIWEVNDIFGASGLITVLPNGKGETLGRRSVGDFSPIPITEEWLVKFGFFSAGDSKYGKKYSYSVSDWGFTIENSFKADKWFFGHEYYDSPDPKENYISLNFCFNLMFVHQLQNIIYDLTGEELTIKE